MDPFQRFLGLTPGNRSLTLFQLIGVAEGESDPSVLKAAFQKVALQLKQADRSVDPEGWKTVVERVKKAQAVLLSPEANAKYYADLMTRSSAPTPPPPKVEVAPPADPISDMAPLLPAGDPNAALDIALLESPSAVATAPWFAPSEVRMQSLAKELNGSGVPQPSMTSNGLSTPVLNVNKPGTKKPVQRVRSSALSRAMPLIVLFGAAFAVLGYGGYMLYSSNQKAQLAQAETTASVPGAPQQPQAPAKVDPIMGNLAPNKPNTNQPPRRGGLPGVNEEGSPIEPITELPPVTRPDPKPNEGMNNETPNNEMKPGDGDMANKPEEPMAPEKPDEAPMEPEKPTGNLGDLVNNPKPDEPKPDENTSGEPMPEREAKPTAAQIKQFSDSMTLARKQLPARAFDKFEAAIAKAEPNAISENQKKQLARLKTLGAAIKKYEEALLTSIAARGAGDNIQVKSTVVGWVEGNGNKFKVRVGGSTDSHTTTTAPLGLTNALVDLVLSPDDPNTKLSKACVALLSAKVAARDEVNKWLEEAVAAELIDADFRKVVDEKYNEDE
jgi:hypothetical protein